eukprot:gene18507-25008_t
MTTDQANFDHVIVAFRVDSEQHRVGSLGSNGTPPVRAYHSVTSKGSAKPPSHVAHDIPVKADLVSMGAGERAVLECLAAELNTSPEAVDLGKSLLHCGMGSLKAVRAATALQEVLGQPVDLTVLLQPMPVHKLLSVITSGGGIIATIPPLIIPENIPTPLPNYQEQIMLLQTLKPKSIPGNIPTPLSNNQEQILLLQTLKRTS